MIKDIKYEFFLALRKGDLYIGQATIKFELVSLPEGKRI